MDTEKVENEKIIYLAKRTKHFCDLLIQQSDSWLSEEEGIKNTEKRLSESENTVKKGYSVLKVFKSYFSYYFP